MIFDYTIRSLLGCMIVDGGEGAMIQAMPLLMTAIGAKGIVDRDLAKLFDATAVVGTPGDVNNLRAHPEVISRAAKMWGHRLETVDMEISGPLRNWILTGPRHSVVDDLCEELTGADMGHASEASPPTNLGHIILCRRMVELDPGVMSDSIRVREMWETAPGWRYVLSNWAEICQAMDVEMPKWRMTLTTKPKPQQRELRRLMSGLEDITAAQAA